MADNRRMQNAPSRAALLEDDARDSSFSLHDLYPALRYNLRFIAIILLASLLVATAWMKYKGPAYIARMVVSQAEGLPQSSSGASSLLGSLGSLGGAAGLSG